MGNKELHELLDKATADAEAARGQDQDAPLPAHVTVSRPNRARSRVLQVRLNPEEFEAVERVAAARGLPASTVAREQLLRMACEDEAPEWTRAQQVNALKAVDIVRAVVSSGDPARNVAAATAEVAKLVPGGVNATDAVFAEVAPDIITGLVNVAGTLAEHSAARSGLSVEQVIADVVEGVRTVKIVD
jgi:predicted DNA binding CopG/RHH family protein